MKSAKRRQQISRWLSIGMLVFGLVGWPVSALTVAKEEMPVILGLSWLALIYSALTAILVSEGNGDS